MAVKILVNDESRDLPPETTVADLLRSLALHEQRVAVRGNGQICQRAEHAARRLADSDRVDIVQMVGGG